ncbi:unnamed protein product [Orchesella dallaii]|uniref:BTB domain-containing protein n=1 Tax=Orchesella dallaii TaxID=48710 RepID=A0ABP1RU26_9HEXA
MSTTRRVYLQNSLRKEFNLTKDCNKYHENNSLLLYTPNVADFTAIDQQYDNEIIKAIAAVLEKFELEKDNKVGCKIYMIPKYDPFYNQLGIFVKLIFSQEFVDKLCTFLTKPKILVVGKGGPVGYSYDESYDCGAFDLPLTSGEFSFELHGFKNISMYFSSVSRFSFYHSVTLEWEDLSVNSPGQFHSDVLHTMLTSGLSESQTNRIEMDDISQEGVTILLAYMYGRDLQLEKLTTEVAFQLLRATHKYNVSNFEAMLVNLIYRKPSDWFSIDNLLAIYFFSVNVSEHQMLSQKMLSTMKMKPKELQTSPVYQAMLESNPRDAADLTLKILEEK